MSKKEEGCLGKSFWGGVGALACVATLIVAIISIPQAAPLRQGISQTFSGTPAATEPPTPTPSPTPTPKVIPINKTMTCTDCPDPSLNFSLIVKNATFDPDKRQLTLLIGVQNNTTTSQSEVHFTLLSLQDLQTGDTTNGTGDGFGGIDLAANQLILFRPTFQFVPATGHEYSLSAKVSGLGFYMIFSPININL